MNNPLINIKKKVHDKKKKLNNILNLKKEYKIEFISTKNNKKINLLENNKLLIVGKYKFYGIYKMDSNLWLWATILPGTNIEDIKNIERIKSFSYIFENDNKEKSIFYYQLLTQDSVYISKSKMLKWINELLLYLSNDIYYFASIINSNIQFITLSSIDEKYV